MNNLEWLYYEEHGQGLPVVFLHGFPLDHTIWSPIVPLLKEHARLILPDLRGHGRSPAPDGGYLMSQMAEDVISLLDTLNIERSVLVGHSMGGYVSLAFARAYPDRLLGLGLIATKAVADTPENRQMRYNAAREVEKHGVVAIAGNLVSKLTTKSNLVEPIQKLILKTSALGVIGVLKGMAERPDSTDLLTSIVVPAVVIAGKSDIIVTLEQSQEMVKLLPHAQLFVLPGARHMPMMETPQPVVNALHYLFREIDIYTNNQEWSA